MDLFKLSGACLCPCSEGGAHGAEGLGLVLLISIDMLATAMLEANYQLFFGLQIAGMLQFQCGHFTCSSSVIACSYSQ